VPLPLDISGKIVSELDTRLGSRFMDLRQPKIKAIFMVRDHIAAAIHDFMDKEGFIEIHTPRIVAEGVEGGTTLFPVEYFGRKAFLAQSPQLFKQIMMATGFDRVYEVGQYFRAEESATTRHLAQFTGWDGETAFIDSYKDVCSLIERGICHIFTHVKKHSKPFLEILGIEPEMPKTPFPYLTHDECNKLLGKKKGTEIGTEAEKKLGEIVKEEFEHDFFFITEFPVSLKKEIFYIMRKDKEYTTSFDLEYKGCELITGNQREHRYEILMNQIKEAGLKPESFEFYLKAFKYGMPPHGGFGFGIDRFTQKFLDLPNIREAVLFPRDKFRLVP
jgi:aspartyl-tRNA synthetase